MKKFKVKIIFQQEHEYEMQAENEQEIYRVVNEIGPLTNVAHIGETKVSRIKKGEIVKVVKEID